MKQWLDKGLDVERISVNVAGPQLQRQNLQQMVENSLSKTGLAPQHLELTETYTMELLDSHIETLQQLNAMGVTIAIDDFGTGASSLSRLKNLNINKLKIDRSFIKGDIQHNDDTAILRAILAMTQSLGLNTIAEGVETLEQEQFLLSQNCLFGQGNLYSEPLRQSDFETFAETMN